MQERSQNFGEVKDDPAVTLATPRFDDDEARRAHPVVPLSEAQAQARHTRFHAGARRQLPLALLAVALLSAVAFGGILALRRSHTNTHAPAPADAAQDAQPTQTNTVPQQAAPAQTGDAPPRTDAANAQENPTAQTPTAPAPNAADEEKTSEQKPEDRAPARASEDRASHTQRGEESPTPPLASRAERRETDGEDSEHRGHLKDRDGHGGRDEDRDEKEALRASRHAKKGEARLVDVLVGRPRP